MSRWVRIPGMLDPHTHLRGLDWAHKGTFATETAAALAGGYWAVLDMPNTAPSTISAGTLARKLAEIGAQAVCDWGVYAGGAKAGNWHEYPAMLPHVCGLKLYNNATTGDLLIDDQGVRDDHFRRFPAGKPIAVHAEEETMLDVLVLVRKYKRLTHFCHVCSAKEIGYLRAAKAEGLPVSVAVTPHHLFLTRDDLERLGTLGLMKPELKTNADREALWAAIADGTVDIVESDHAPHLLAEKASDVPPFGVPGLQTTLPLLLGAVREGRLTLERVIELVAVNPRRVFGFACPGETYTLVDVEDSYTIERGQIVSLCGWSPFEGMRAGGRVRETWIRGVKAFDGERVRVAPGFGRNLVA